MIVLESNIHQIVFLSLIFLIQKTLLLASIGIHFGQILYVRFLSSLLQCRQVLPYLKPKWFIFLTGELIDKLWFAKHLLVLSEFKVDRRSKILISTKQITVYWWVRSACPLYINYEIFMLILILTCKCVFHTIRTALLLSDVTACSSTCCTWVKAEI